MLQIFHLQRQQVLLFLQSLELFIELRFRGFTKIGPFFSQSLHLEFQLLQRVMYTCSFAGFDRMSLAVVKEG